MICYMDSFEFLVYCYQFIEEFFGEDVYDLVEQVFENSIFVMFYKDYIIRMKIYIIMEFRKFEIKICLILVIVVLGMGLNVLGVSYIMYFRLLILLEKYMQELGRVGRGGQLSRVILYFNKSDIVVN